ncbi:maleylpyruvate isomerase family mycothiol-dependent enzyme [Kitasatospora aureofaciens]|uniref:maleylpyruvate isomerase family mycothiol-dependent enzyme n=1 Tax=Kitasatospora aureofaciens TaxID=1894 RepID=UPI001C4950C0|nr:maleylpyruvate isomerase family mycothiol-dependent enzyme [Kitasatospora aureofaciens]MBV6697539.1 maleylpyruvate isomerase family mycothiol-dependent enzyme [Kitasatospora aureofaciens]
MTDPQSAAALAASRLSLVEESTRHLLHTVSEVKPEAVAEPSALPGWTRGHVLAHLARNADSLVNLLNGARTGTDIPQYASNEARDEEIERDAPRPVDVQLADLAASHERFAAAAALLPAEAWTADVRHRSGYIFPASDIPWKRLMEVEYHLVDLDGGYTPAHWPEEFAVAEFRRLAGKLAGTDLAAVELIADDTEDRGTIGTGEPGLAVEGPVRSLLAWLSGRSDGAGLRLTPHAELPQLPPLG